jgi:hypothetical protein
VICEDLCDGFFPVKSVIISESIGVRKMNNAREVSEVYEFNGCVRGIRGLRV